MLTFFKNLFSHEPKKNSQEQLSGIAMADSKFQDLVTQRKIPGMGVTIIKRGEALLQKGYGFADLERGIPVDPKHTVFRIASISKCITGLALGKMMEEGLVDLDTSFYEYVPYYPKREHDFTLRQLASHTAGIRAYRGKEFALNISYSIKDSTTVFMNDPLVFEPGKGYLYNSFDSVLLSLAMQEAGQEPFESYVREKVLNPLGLENTFSPAKEDDSYTPQHLAEFYSKTSTGFRKAATVNNFYKIAGGGYLSTCEDIAKMGQAILDRRLLDKDTYKEILTTQLIHGKPTYYGLGFQVSEDAKGRKLVGHVGNSVGAYTNFFVYPQEEVVISILINCTDPKVQQELDNAIDAILDLPSS